MKNLIKYLILAIFLAFGCKKESTTEEDPEEVCVESSFSVVIDKNFKPVWITEDKMSNILVLGTVQGNVSVLKTDPYGKELWMKEFTEISGKPMNIIPVQDGYLLTSGTMQFTTDYGSPIPEILAQTGFALGSLNNYLPVYELFENYIPIFCEPSNNRLYITKIGESGAIVQQLSYPDVNFSPGNQMVSRGDDSYLFAAFQYRGDGAEVEGLINPAIVFPRNENFIYFLRLDATGELIAINYLDDVLIFEMIDQISDREVSFDLVKNGDQYTLNLPNITYHLNSNAGYEDDYQPKYDFNGNHTYSIAFADENANYFIGRADFYDNPDSEYYIMKADLNGNEIWYRLIDEFTDARLTAADDGFIALITRTGGTTFYKYNSTGDLLWEFTPDKKPACFISSCNGSLIYTCYDAGAQNISITKMEASGN